MNFVRRWIYNLVRPRQRLTVVSDDERQARGVSLTLLASEYWPESCLVHVNVNDGIDTVTITRMGNGTGDNVVARITGRDAVLGMEAALNAMLDGKQSRDARPGSPRA